MIRLCKDFILVRKIGWWKLLFLGIKSCKNINLIILFYCKYDIKNVVDNKFLLMS